jgi:hypothetical protein
MTKLKAFQFMLLVTPLSIHSANSMESYNRSTHMIKEDKVKGQIETDGELEDWAKEDTEALVNGIQVLFGEDNIKKAFAKIYDVNISPGIKYFLWYALSKGNKGDGTILTIPNDDEPFKTISGGIFSKIIKADLKNAFDVANSENFYKDVSETPEALNFFFQKLKNVTPDAGSSNVKFAMPLKIRFKDENEYKSYFLKFISGKSKGQTEVENLSKALTNKHISTAIDDLKKKNVHLIFPLFAGLFNGTQKVTPSSNAIYYTLCESANGQDMTRYFLKMYENSDKKLKNLQGHAQTSGFKIGKVFIPTGQNSEFLPKLSYAVGRAVALLHNKNLVHGDLHMNNLFIGLTDYSKEHLVGKYGENFISNINSETIEEYFTVSMIDVETVKKMSFDDFTYVKDLVDIHKIVTGAEKYRTVGDKKYDNPLKGADTTVNEINYNTICVSPFFEAYFQNLSSDNKEKIKKHFKDLPKKIAQYVNQAYLFIGSLGVSDNMESIKKLVFEAIKNNLK